MQLIIRLEYIQSAQRGRQSGVIQTIICKWLNFKKDTNQYDLIPLLRFFFLQQQSSMHRMPKESSQAQKYLLSCKRSQRHKKVREQVQKHHSKQFLSYQQEEVPNDDEGSLAIKRTMERLSHKSCISVKKELSFQVFEDETPIQCCKRQQTGNTSLLQPGFKKLNKQRLSSVQAKSTARESKASSSSNTSQYSSYIFKSSQCQRQQLPTVVAEPITFQSSSIQYLFLELQKIFTLYPQVNLKRGSFIPYRRKTIRGEYEMKERLGEGAFGAAYRCIHLDSRTVRTMKVIKKASIIKNREIVRRKLQILRKLDHPNVIKLYQAYQYDQTLYLALQYCGGGTLQDYIDRDCSILTSPLLKQIIRQLFTAVNYIHQMGVLHRDIKPQNILLTDRIDNSSRIDDVRVKIIDFGLSIHCEGKYFKDWRTVGSPMYMAPEVFTGIYSRKCDTWSCGIVTHMLLLGFNPFLLANTSDILAKVSSYQFQKSQRWNLISKEQQQIILLLTNRNYLIRSELSQILNLPFFATDKPILSEREKNNILVRIKRHRRNTNVFGQILRMEQKLQAKLSRFFNALDADCNGLISRQDMQRCYPNISIEQIDKIFAEIDLNSSGVIDFAEFVFVMIDKKDIFTLENIKAAFKAINVSKSGLIVRQELSIFMDHFQQSQQKEIQQLFNQMDFEKIGWISCQVFTWYILSNVYFKMQ